MKVELVGYTQNALDLMLRTKNTRLKNLGDPANWSEEKRQEHLSYMKDTIKSSWEFVSYTFEISGVTRAFTHQLVRTRTGSYAQEAQRVVDARDHEVLKPQFKDETCSKIWDDGIQTMLEAYGWLIDQGEASQDARGILPTNITTSIMAKFNLRTLHEMGKLRMCTRTQGEYQDVFRKMRELVIGVHPWVEEHEFIEVHCVSTGTCAFPRYGKAECPVYIPEMDNRTVKDHAKRVFWAVRHEAAPVAKDGKAM